jgi:hypothetical protein
MSSDIPVSLYRLNLSSFTGAFEKFCEMFIDVHDFCTEILWATFKLEISVSLWLAKSWNFLEMFAPERVFVQTKPSKGTVLGQIAWPPPA